MRRIDSHHHLWRVARGDYGWLTPSLGALYRDFGVDDLAPLLTRQDIAATVLVQAAATDAETEWLLDIASRTGWIAGVVGWADLAAGDAPSRLAALAARPKLKGARPMLQDLPDARFIVRDDVQPGLVAMAELGLRFDALIRAAQLPQLLAVRDLHPSLAIVIDHAAKPDIAGGEHDRWAADLRAVAADGITCCKLSGLVTEAGSGWRDGRLQRYVDTVLDAFGPQRVMWGSDWPVLTLAASYDDWAAATDDLLAGLPDTDRAAVLGGTAARFYGLEG